MQKHIMLVLFTALIVPLSGQAYMSYHGTDSVRICEMKRNAYNRILQGNAYNNSQTQAKETNYFQQAKGWDISILDTMNHGIFLTPLALDKQDNPHIVCERNGDKLLHIYYNADSSKWLSDLPLGGAMPSLAMDSLGYPHISCFFNGLGYIHKDATGWDTLQLGGPWVDWTSIALDSKGRPHIGWAGQVWSDADMIFYTRWTGTAWETDTVDTAIGANSVFYPTVSLALDTANCPYLTYPSDEGHLKVRYARKTTKGWTIEIVDTDTCYLDSHCSIIIDKYSIPCIIYASASNSSTEKREKYARRETMDWAIETIDTIAYLKSSLFIDKNNTPHISYENNYKVRYVWKDSTGWQNNLVDSVSRCYDIRSTSLAIDNDGYTHISYKDAVSDISQYHELKYAKGIGVGIEENNDNCLMLNAQLKAEPNPFVEKTVVSGSASGGFRSAQQEKETKIQIYDVSGKLIEGTKDNIIGKKLKSGVYFIKVNNYKPLKVVKLR
ncbi:MAG: T9SS type A sorting domain-containing protein [bacterium]|nr:T9SS type A sorting domain-containing protein [bacterium]